MDQPQLYQTVSQRKSAQLSRRQFLRSAAIATTVLPLLAACGVPAAPGAAAGGESAAATQEQVQIVRSFWGSPDQIDVAREADARFHENNPDILVEPIAVPHASYRDKLMTMIAGGDAPDIMHVDAYWMHNFVENNMLAALDDFIEADEAYPPELIEGLWPIPDHHAINGKTYSIVTSESPRILFYNESMFKEAGLATPSDLAEQGQWDWNAYLDAAVQLTTGEGGEKVFGAATYITTTSRYVWTHCNGGSILNNERTAMTLSMPENIQALQFQLDLLKEHKVAPLPEESEILGGNTQAFMAQRMAMVLDGVWSATSFRHIEDFEWAAAPVPTSPTTGYTRTIYKPNSTTMPTGIVEEHKDAAWRWLSFDPIGQNKLNIDKGANFGPFAETKQYFLDNTPIRNAKVVYDAFDNGEVTYLPLNTTWQQWDKVVNDELSLVVNGEKTLEEAIAAIEPQVNEILASA